MRFRLLSHGTPVGEADLDTYDATWKAVRGVFQPNAAWGQVMAALPPIRRHAPAAAIFASVLARRDALGLLLVDEARRPVPTASIEVEQVLGSGVAELVVCPARPEQWLSSYGAPYGQESGVEDE